MSASNGLRAAGYACWFAAGAEGVLLGLEIASGFAGGWGVAVASLLMPLTVAAAPWYALLVWNSWFPVLFVYGGGGLATLLLRFAAVRPATVRS